MKFEHGYYFPDDETHFQPFLAVGEYQILQREMGLGVCTALGVPFNCAVDIGAHVGLWAKPLSRAYKKIICFEPNPANVECLRKNMDGIHCDIHPFGLADVAARQSFYMPSDFHDNGHNSGAGSFGVFENRDATTGQADVKTLDSIHIPEINFIKMDVQGWEMNVLRGGQETLRRTQPIILCENHPERADLVAAFAQLGFEKVLRVVKEDIFVPASLLNAQTRRAIMLYFNEHKAYFESLG
jgi:FkbM family methyltransferase